MFRGKVRYAGLKLPHLPRRFRAVEQRALQSCVRVWRDETGPVHFTVEAFSRYTGREMGVYPHRRKEKRSQGGSGGRRDYTNPNVWTGALRAAFLRGTMRMTTTGGGATLKVRAAWPNLPRYAYYTKHGKHGSPGPQKYKELTIMTGPERRQYAKHFVETTNALLAQQGETP